MYLSFFGGMIRVELVEKYFLVVSGAFDRSPIVYDVYPTKKEISEAIVEMNGRSARVEKRYVFGGDE